MTGKLSVLAFAARPVVACARFLIVARRARRKPTELGDLERCALRASNAHSAHVWRDVAEAVDARYRGKPFRSYFRADAAFAIPELYEFLEAVGFKCAIPLRAKKLPQESIAYLLKPPSVGRRKTQIGCASTDSEARCNLS